MSAADPTVAGQPRDHRILGHPRGLATLFFIEMWERFSYYGMRGLLLLFMNASLAEGGLGMSAAEGGAVYGLFTAGAYLCCLPGGWVADRLLGLRRSVLWGGVLICLGNLLLAVPGGYVLFYVGLLVVALGTGLLKPNATCLVGELYKDDTDSRRDSAFSIYYLGINLGAMLAPFVAGTIGETISFRSGFGCAGLAMIIGLVQYQWTGHWLKDAGLRPQAQSADHRSRNARILLAGGALLLVCIVLAVAGPWRADVVRIADAAGAAMVALAIVFFAYVLLLGGLTPAEKRRTGVIALFLVCAALFWAGYEQAGSTLNLFTRDYTDRSFLGSHFSSGQHPVTWYQTFQSVFIWVFGPVFAWGWLALGRRGRDPSAPAKLGFGMLQLGASFVVMMLAAQLVLHTGHKVLPTWIIVTYLLQTTGELCLSPIGLSNVSKLAPPRFLGQMMGTWFLGTAIGNLAAGMIGGLMGGESVAAMPGQFLDMALVGGAAGVALLLIARPVRRWMGDA